VVKRVANEVGRTPAQVALNWTLNRPSVVAPILGVRTMSQLEDNLASTGWRLDDEHVHQLNEVSETNFWHPHDFHVKMGFRKPDRQEMVLEGYNWRDV
jgi:aryl-alcohol dehydrogenase-like predicted oxidoreductase